MMPRWVGVRKTCRGGLGVSLSGKSTEGKVQRPHDGGGHQIWTEKAHGRVASQAVVLPQQGLTQSQSCWD